MSGSRRETSGIDFLLNSFDAYNNEADSTGMPSLGPLDDDVTDNGQEGRF